VIAGQREPAELALDPVRERLGPVELVAAHRRIPLGEMREPVLLAGQPDDALQRERHAGLLVGLELREVDDDVGVEHRLRHAVLVAAAGMVGDGRLVMAPVEPEPGARGRAGGGEGAPLAEVDDPVAAGVAGQRRPDQEAEVVRAAAAADVVEEEPRRDAEVAEVDERGVVAAGADGVDGREDAERAGDLLDLAPLDRGVDDADPARGAGGADRVIEHRAEQRAVGAGRRELPAGDLLVEVLRGDQVRLDDHPIPGLDEVPERVPARRPGAGAVEAELAEQRLDRLIDRVRRIERRRLDVMEAWPRDRDDPGSAHRHGEAPLTAPRG
jgi:hypothetical protein